jgi:hypothetical protein
MSKHLKPGGSNPHSNPNNDGAPNQKSSITSDVHVCGEVLIEPTPKEALARETEKTKKDAKWRKKWRLEVANFWVLTVYAALTAVLAYESIKSTDTTRQSLVDVQRAVVSADTFTAARQLGNNGQIDGMQFTVGWKNSGTTATKDLVYWGNWRTEPFGTKIDKTFDFSDIWAPTGEKVPYTHGFATAQKLIRYYPIVIPSDVITAVVDEKIELVFWGKATYNDVFKDTGIHTSEYCLIVMGFDGVKPFDAKAESGTTYPRFLNCPVHNCHDDECREN